MILTYAYPKLGNEPVFAKKVELEVGDTDFLATAKLEIETRILSGQLK